MLRESKGSGSHDHAAGTFLGFAGASVWVHWPGSAKSGYVEHPKENRPRRNRMKVERDSKQEALGPNSDAEKKGQTHRLSESPHQTPSSAHSASRPSTRGTTPHQLPPNLLDKLITFAALMTFAISEPYDTGSASMTSLSACHTWEYCIGACLLSLSLSICTGSARRSSLVPMRRMGVEGAAPSQRGWMAEAEGDGQ